MYKISVELFDKLIAQLDADGHYDLVNDLLRVKQLRVKQLTPKKSEYQGGGWGDIGLSAAELRGIQGIYG